MTFRYLIPDVLRNYQAADDAPLAGRSFYRLALVDKDGSYSCSDVESVNDLLPVVT